MTTDELKSGQIESVAPKTRFICIPLGVEGGLTEGNLPAYLLAPCGTADFLSLDAGTLLSGLRVACRKGAFSRLPLTKDEGLSLEGSILRRHIKAYLLTHPYLDHVGGLVTISPNDSSKPIIGSEAVVNDIRDHLFNWHVWPNLCNEGAQPAIGQYRYVRVSGNEPFPVPGTAMSVSAFPLAHGIDTDSTAFLIEADGAFVLYMGDTGPDEVEKRPTTEDLWRVITPLIRADKLHGIFIEASYPDERPDHLLFSHLTPAWILRAFRKLASLVDAADPQKALSGLKVIITHIKPDLTSGVEPREIVTRQLSVHNDLNLNLIVAEQGIPFEL